MGQLVSSEVLPKVAAELKRAALEGGAFELALKGLRVTEGQMMTESQRAGNKIFKSEFSEGLSELYKTISEILKTSGPQLEKLGSIFGSVFKGIAHMLKVLDPVMKVVLNNFEALFGLAMIMKIKTLQKVLVSFGLSAQGSLLKAFLPLTAALAAAEELASLFSDQLVGNMESKAGQQINLIDGTTSKLVRKDGKLFMDKGSVTDGTKPTMDIKKVTEKDFDAMSFGGKASYLWDVFSQGTSGAVNATHMSAAKGVFGSGSSVSETMNKAQTKTPTAVIINNTYHNATADEMLRHQQMQSMMGMSTTK